MISLKDNVLYFSLLSIVGHVWTLVQLPELVDNDIAITEAILRNTVNSLFANLRVRDVKHKPRLKDFSLIHSFFVSMTLKDCDNLKEIARLTRVNNIDNNTKHLVTQINEILNAGDNSNEEIDDIYVTQHIETFVTKLRHLKEIHGLNENIGNLSINSEILKILNKNENILSNLTNEIHNENNTDENVLSDDVWHPTEQSGRRIFDGHRTRIKYFPFVATIQFFEKFHCAGSIIRKDMVVTAASCLQLAWNNRFFRENPAFLSVQIGCDYYEAGGENIAVLDVFFHPDYQPTNLHNNLALLRLSTHIVFSKEINNVKRIRFDRHPSPLPSNTDGIMILGYGARDPTNIIYGPWRNRLSYAELDFYPIHECQEIYSKEYVTYKNFCAGFFTKGTGACNHDIGGPGISGGILLGVISFGPPVCGTPDAPTVFTKMGYYATWIDSIMHQQVPQIVRLSTKRRVRSTFALHYSDATRAPFTVRPIKKGEHLPGYIPIPTGAGSLRILQDDKLFKEFMSTMFESREAKDYQAPESEEKSECDEETSTVKAKRKTKHKSTLHTTISLKASETDSENTEVKKKRPKVKGNKSKKVAKKDNVSSQNASADYDSKLDDEITNLLDDLDLYKLLNSEEPIIDSGDQNDKTARARASNDLSKSNNDHEKVPKSSIKKMSHPNVKTTNQSHKKAGKKSVKKVLFPSEKNDNNNDDSEAPKKSVESLISSSDKDEVVSEDKMVTTASVKNLLHSLKTEEDLNENKSDEHLPELSDIDEDTTKSNLKENIIASDKNLLQSSDNNKNINTMTSQKADESALNLSDNDADAEGDNNLSETYHKVQNADILNKTKIGSTETGTPSSEKEDSAQSDDDNESSEDDGGLSIV